MLRVWQSLEQSDLPEAVFVDEETAALCAAVLCLIDREPLFHLKQEEAAGPAAPLPAGYPTSDRSAPPVFSLQTSGAGRVYSPRSPTTVPGQRSFGGPDEPVPQREKGSRMRRILMIVLLAMATSAPAAMAAKATLECDWYSRSTGIMIAYGFTCDSAWASLLSLTGNAADSTCQGLDFDTFCGGPSGVVGSCAWNGTTGSFQANGERTYTCADIVPQ